MGNNIKWNKVDRTIERKTVLFGGIHNLSSALNYGVCPYCGNRIEWTYNPDADGSSYHGECGCEDMKGYYYYAKVVAVSVSLEKKD